MQNYDERYRWILDHRTDKLFLSLEKLTQMRTSLLVPGLLGGPDVRGQCAPLSSDDVIETPGP